jgi:hypothetical protein
MLNRLILTELAALEARFEAGCVVCIYLIDSYDNVVRHFLRLIPEGRSLWLRYVFSGGGGGMGKAGAVILCQYYIFL